ncbi:hypothetical protein [Geothrix sp. PMB-07]|uniref:hypothetical protein n=1 Tax=Geothrix sp. PMB-07 TaxID=3068640 RepID=UPI0027429B9A|nr:hypothetical protein [Geothrix sp. PMB-07]WLT30141.1 hypothetical protein Q9293_10470 [Geothrix sp. PMB-07]
MGTSINMASKKALACVANTPSDPYRVVTMHPLLRSLDLNPIAGNETTVYGVHPIREAAPARSRGIPILFSLGMTPLILYGLSISLTHGHLDSLIRREPSQHRESVSLTVQEAEVAFIRPPTKYLMGSESPGGEGHREGTDGLDPRLVAHTSIFSQPSDAIDPDELTLSPRATPVFLSLNPTLPLRSGGNGLASGTGRDSARGSGGHIREQKTYDFKLIPTRQVSVRHQLKPGEPTKVAADVLVRLQIGEDGVPMDASVLSGPAFLHAESIQAALQWRFEPLAPHGLKAPLSLTLVFQPFLLPAL